MNAAAPPALFFRPRSTLARLRLDPELEIGAGGEAVVYGMPGDGGRVAKIYHEPTVDRARKLAAMVSNPPAMPAGTAIAWPLDVLLAERGGFAGFLMPRADGPRVFEFYNPSTRRGTAPGFHAALLHRAGRNLAAAFHALHAAGYVVGDVNESNLLVSPADASVTLVDADSLQVRDEESGGVFRSRVGKPEFTPPELLGMDFGEVDRTAEHDRFGLAVLLFLLLMEGTHPFATRLDSRVEAEPVEERIRQGLFPHARADDACHPPRLSPPFQALHWPLRRLFLRAFVAGHTDPSARPTCEEWRDALEAAEAALVTCAANPRHRHAPHLAACPWCERAARLGGRDPFPEGVVAAPPRPRRPPPRRVPVAAPAPAPAPRPAPAAPVVTTPFGTRPAPLVGLASRAALRSVGPMGMMHQQSGSPAPFVFGPSGVFNPAVGLGPMAVLAFMGGGMPQLLGAFGFLLALGALVWFGWKRVRPATILLAVAATVVTVTLMGLAYTVNPDDPASAFPPFVADAPQPLPAGAIPLDDPRDVKALDDYILPELRSVPISKASLGMPPEVIGFSSGRIAVDLRSLDLPPRLENGAEAAAAAAAAYARRGSPDSVETVMLWLRVEADGRVSDRRVITSSPDLASYVALDASGYLGYSPGTKGGIAVPVWVVQPIVFVP